MDRQLNSDMNCEAISESQPALQLDLNQQKGQLIIALTVIAKSQQAFNGNELAQLLNQLSLQYGEMAIFHKLSQPGNQVLYSLADMMQPGTLRTDTLAMQQVKGVVLFMNLPLPGNGLVIFDEMLNTATTIADKLNGDLCDEQRQLFNKERIEQLRNQIFNFNISLQSNSNQFNYDYTR